MTDEQQPAAFHITGETLKNAGVALTVAGTLIGIINFGVSKIAAYDSYGQRIAKLEASDQFVHQVAEEGKAQGFKIDADHSDIGSLKNRVDSLSTDVIQLRISAERMKTLLEQRR